MASNERFWEHKSLFEMTPDEWESVCDGCAKCCLQQLEDEESQTLVFTNVVCDLLDESTCRCTDYENRSERVPSCVSLNKKNLMQTVEFAPPSCAYRLLATGEPLPSWHPLITGEPVSTLTAGQSIKGRVIKAKLVSEDSLEDHVVEWPTEFAQ